MRQSYIYGLIKTNKACLASVISIHDVGVERGLGKGFERAHLMWDSSAPKIGILGIINQITQIPTQQLYYLMLC